ncbi:hypothetical protein SAMN05421740_1014 [Parapedobacter koreensis]|uniref:Uncharacterized protein n=1 Tax=Parapedobacter koreensis TaxID=332977 RepID=A0A1H7EUQ3_9SPHI|nr:hypothetical protein SAMN05421740_1014 [Parapedobacter koreensis]
MRETSTVVNNKKIVNYFGNKNFVIIFGNKFIVK